MHDLDRTQLEQEQYEHEQYEQQESGVQAESPLNELQEMELATELLEVTNEHELDRFLGSLVKKAASAAGQFLRSDTGQALKGILKDAAKQALPVVGGALGGAIGGAPGKSIGSRLGQGVGDALGLELEGLSAEDQQFEVARQFVRFGGAAARRAAALQQRTAPRQAARAGATTAARFYAPGLVTYLSGGGNGQPTSGHRRSGRWERRGRAIVLYGV